MFEENKEEDFSKKVDETIENTDSEITTEDEDDPYEGFAELWEDEYKDEEEEEELSEDDPKWL